MFGGGGRMASRRNFFAIDTPGARTGTDCGGSVWRNSSCWSLILSSIGSLSTLLLLVIDTVTSTLARLWRVGLISLISMISSEGKAAPASNCVIGPER